MAGKMVDGIRVRAPKTAEKPNGAKRVLDEAKAKVKRPVVEDDDADDDDRPTAKALQQLADMKEKREGKVKRPLAREDDDDAEVA